MRTVSPLAVCLPPQPVGASAVRPRVSAPGPAGGVGRSFRRQHHSGPGGLHLRGHAALHPRRPYVPFVTEKKKNLIMLIIIIVVIAGGYIFVSGLIHCRCETVYLKGCVCCCVCVSDRQQLPDLPGPSHALSPVGRHQLSAAESSFSPRSQSKSAAALPSRTTSSFCKVTKQS